MVNSEEDKRNTGKEKKKRNLRHPYKKGGRRRCMEDTKKDVLKKSNE